jgi:hypothetical protein
MRIRYLESVRTGKLPQLKELGIEPPVDTGDPVDSRFPYDNEGMGYIKGALESAHDQLYLHRGGAGGAEDFEFGYEIVLW